MHWYNVLYSSALQLLYTCKCTTFSFKSSTFGWPYISLYVSKWMHILYRTECYKILTPIVYTIPFQFKPKTLTFSISPSVNVNQKRKRKCTKLTGEKTLAPASFTFKWWEQSQTPLLRCDGGGRWDGEGYRACQLNWQGTFRVTKGNWKKWVEAHLPNPDHQSHVQLGHCGFPSAPGGELISQFTQFRWETRLWNQLTCHTARMKRWWLCQLCWQILFK